MRAVLHLDPELSMRPFAGHTVGAHWLDLLAQAGFSVVDHTVEPALHVDGRYIAVRPESLAALTEHDHSLRAPDGSVIAQVGLQLHVDHVLSGGFCPQDEAHNVRLIGGFSAAERTIRQRVAAEWERCGVRLVDPMRVTIDATVTIAAGAIIWPDVTLLGATRVDEGAEIRPGCWIEDSTIGAGALIKPHSVCTGAHIGPHSQVGPMAHLRPGSTLDGNNKVGNFVEVKKAVLHEGAKASHLTYLGDAEIGANANIGAGTITCNYDGHRKHRTVIGAGAFIGSNTALVAPIDIGAGAIVGAGSTLTRDVPDHALAVVRGTTKILEGKGRALNQRNARLKAQELAGKAE